MYLYTYTYACINMHVYICMAMGQKLWYSTLVNFKIVGIYGCSSTQNVIP